MTLFKTPTARYAAHVALAFVAAFVPLLLATNEPLSKTIIWSAAVAAGRAVVGALTSTNPKVGKNVV